MSRAKNTETLESLKEKIFNNRGSFLAYNTGDEIQLVVKENRQRPGAPIFVREDGKCGFSTINSIPFTIGDTVRGKIKIDTETVFFVEVNEIITREQQ